MYNSNIPLHPIIEPNSPWIIPYDESRESSLYTLEQEEKEYNAKLRSIAAQPASVPIGFMMSSSSNSNSNSSSNNNVNAGASGGIAASFHHGLSPIPRYDGHGGGGTISAPTSSGDVRGYATGVERVGATTRSSSSSSHHHHHRRRRSGGRTASSSSRQSPHYYSTSTANAAGAGGNHRHHPVSTPTNHGIDTITTGTSSRQPDFPTPIVPTRTATSTTGRRRTSMESAASMSSAGMGHHRHHHGGSDSSLDFTMDDSRMMRHDSMSSSQYYHHH